jgi:uncharacterized DUF497 family protein
MMNAEFRWNAWNRAKLAKHGVSEFEAQQVVRNAARPYPRKMGDGKRQVVGRGQGDRFVQVIYIIDPDDTLFVIHAMPLTGRRRR